MLLGQGKHHQVYLWEDENYVLKLPQKNTNISYKQARKSVDFFQQEFPEYLPETTVLPGNQEYPYQVIQKRVEGILLGDFLRNQGISPQIGNILSSFLERAISILDGKIIGFDIIGTPPSPEFKGKWEGCTNIIVNPVNQDIFFVDCVIPSRAIGRSFLVNRILRNPSYHRRKANYFKLMEDLCTKRK